jgi:hypothetical protein
VSVVVVFGGGVGGHVKPRAKLEWA